MPTQKKATNPESLWTPVADPASAWTPVDEPAKTAAPPKLGDAGVPGNAWTSPHPITTLGANARESAGQLLEMGKGAVKGAGNTLSSFLRGANTPTYIPLSGSTPTNYDAADKLQAWSKPSNTMQKIGYGGEQAAEFLLPTGAEEGLAKLGQMGADAGKLPKFAASAGRLIGAGVHNGTINKLQGGSFTGGAAAGALGAGVGIGLKKLAPIAAESALKVRGTDRAFGRTPGQAILDETTGVTPRKIADQAGEKVEGYSNDLEDMARQSDTPASLATARDAAGRAFDAAEGRNNDTTIKKIAKMGKQLSTDYFGNDIPETIPAQRLLHLKRGIGDLVSTWNPAEESPWVNGQVQHVYNAMDNELDRAVPGISDVNQKISTLLPVSKRANAADLNAGLIHRALDRFGAHTGVLGTLVTGGAGAGYHYGGVPGALLGAAAGIVGPEIAANPTVKMIAARVLNSQALQKLAIPAAEGGLLGLAHNDDQPADDPHTMSVTLAPTPGGMLTDDETVVPEDTERGIQPVTLPVTRPPQRGRP